GIDLEPEDHRDVRDGLPRMRGDRPPSSRRWYAMPRVTPHARGSTLPGVSGEYDNLGYPACAGIDPHLRAHPPRNSRLPRMRGDRPWSVTSSIPSCKVTPHARGSTRPSTRR